MLGSIEADGILNGWKPESRDIGLHVVAANGFSKYKSNSSDAPAIATIRSHWILVGI
jgi:hypothetical protein